MDPMRLRTLPSVLLSAADVSQLLDVSKVHVLRLVKSGHLNPTVRIGEHDSAPMGFAADEVERLRALRAGEAGDVLDRVDITASERDPSEDRSAYIRDEWLKAIRYVVARTPDRTFHRGQVWRLVPDDARGPASGALITALIRQRRIEHTGDYDEAGDARNRHGSTPCKVYRVTGGLP